MKNNLERDKIKKNTLEIWMRLHCEEASLAVLLRMMMVHEATNAILYTFSTETCQEVFLKMYTKILDHFKGIGV
jgi:hypothetical protein